MHRLRAILICCIALALPIQGLAGTMMMIYGSSNGQIIEASTTGAATSGVKLARGQHQCHSAAESTQARALSDPHHASQITAASPVSESHDSFGQSPDKFGHSTCAAYCALIALPANFSIDIANGLAHRMLTTLPVGVSSHLPDGLERPPRSLLT